MCAFWSILSGHPSNSYNGQWEFSYPWIYFHITYWLPWSPIANLHDYVMRLRDTLNYGITENKASMKCFENYYRRASWAIKITCFNRISYSWSQVIKLSFGENCSQIAETELDLWSLIEKNSTSELIMATEEATGDVVLYSGYLSLVFSKRINIFLCVNVGKKLSHGNFPMLQRSPVLKLL